MFGVAIGIDGARYAYGELYANDIEWIKNSLEIVHIGDGEIKPFDLRNYSPVRKNRPRRSVKKRNAFMIDVVSEIKNCMLDISTQIPLQVLKSIGLINSRGTCVDGVCAVNYMYADAGDTRIRYNDDGKPMIGGTFFYSDFIKEDGSLRTEMAIDRRHDFDKPCIMVLSVRPERLVKSFEDTKAAAREDYLYRRAMEKQRQEMLKRNGILSSTDLFALCGIRTNSPETEPSHVLKMSDYRRNATDEVQTEKGDQQNTAVDAKKLAKELNHRDTKLFERTVEFGVFRAKYKKKLPKID